MLNVAKPVEFFDAYTRAVDALGIEDEPLWEGGGAGWRERARARWVRARVGRDGLVRGGRGGREAAASDEEVGAGVAEMADFERMGSPATVRVTAVKLSAQGAGED